MRVVSAVGLAFIGGLGAALLTLFVTVIATNALWTFETNPYFFGNLIPVQLMFLAVTVAVLRRKRPPTLVLPARILFWVLAAMSILIGLVMAYVAAVLVSFPIFMGY